MPLLSFGLLLAGCIVCDCYFLEIINLRQPFWYSLVLELDERMQDLKNELQSFEGEEYDETHKRKAIEALKRMEKWNLFTESHEVRDWCLLISCGRLWIIGCFSIQTRNMLLTWHLRFFFLVIICHTGTPKLYSSSRYFSCTFRCNIVGIYETRHITLHFWRGISLLRKDSFSVVFYHTGGTLCLLDC